MAAQNTTKTTAVVLAGVPALVFAQFGGVPEDAQQGELFLPMWFGSKEDAARFSIVFKH